MAFTDSHPDAKGGFAEEVFDYSLSVDFPEELLLLVKEEYRDPLVKILAEDPRPAYKKDSDKEYGMLFADYEIFFSVKENLLKVTRVVIK